MKKSLPACLILFFSLCSFSLVRAQCNLNPVIKPDNLILCPNTQDTIYVTQEFDTYQWYKLNKPIEGATQRYLVVDQYQDAGYLFKVVVTKNGCTDTSKKVLVDGYAFASPITVTNGNSSYFDVPNQISVFCKNEPVSLYFPDPYNTNVQWYNYGEAIPGANSQTYKVTENGSYTVTGSPAVCPDFEVCQCVAVNIAIDKFSVSIMRSCDSLVASKGASFQWYQNGNLIAGATSKYYIPTKRGLYSVEATDRYNCSSKSETVYYTPKNKIVISPNPAQSFITLQVDADNGSQLVISDLYGNRRVQVATTGNNQRISVASLTTGTYVLHLLDKKGNTIATEKFMKK